MLAGGCSKVVFIGPVGVGKTTAVQHLSDIPVVATDVVASDAVVLRSKQTTTVALDYGKVTLNNGRIVHLYGTPGQERFNFMWDILTQGKGTALVLLINNSRPQPLRDMEFFISNFRKFAEAGRMLVAVTHTDLVATPTLMDYSGELRRLKVDLPLFKVDARRRDAVAVLLDVLHQWNE
jgi:hypothetical protein